MPAATATRRELGQYYTPSTVARQIVTRCLDRFWDEHRGECPRVLDPACGDGAFLIEAFDRLCRRFAATDPTERLEVARQCVFGVDVDANAIRLLRQRLLERIAPDRSLEGGVNRVLRENVRAGCALTGPDFNDSATDAADGAIHWRLAFPEVTLAGGFDCIVGNPPYRRELNSRDAWEQITQSPLGCQWRQARMDLWHYFLHRALDLLRPGGWLSFIVNSYWTASRGARPLIERLERETTIEEVELLGDAGVFANVSGRHLIFRLRNGRTEQPCRIVDLRNCGSALTRSGNARPSQWIPQAKLFHDGQLVTKVPCRLDLRQCRRTLGDNFEVRQGIAENPPWITARVNRRFGNRFSTGAGVFVLRNDEVEQLRLSPAERRLLRPYFPTSVIRRFRCPTEPTHQLFYLTRDTAPNLDALPRIRGHLNRYRVILERRREVRTGRIGWWHLHWPREERLFTQPRILSVQMGRVPQFVWAEQPTFVGFSVNVILLRAEATLPLPALTAILNSSLAHQWFQRYAKERGVALEINGLLLRRFPLPRRDAQLEDQLCELSRQRHQTRDEDRLELESEMNELVSELYDDRSITE